MNGKYHFCRNNFFRTLLLAGMAVVIPAGYAQDYKSIEITNIEPVDILPIIGQIDTGDTGAYEHIKHLRVAEATRIRDMMWEYGAGNYSAEEYKQLMARLNTGMVSEHPKGYTNYEVIGGSLWWEASEHAHDERDMLNTLINHSNFKVSCPDGKSWDEVLIDYVGSNSNSINILGCSAYDAASNKDNYDKYLNKKNIKDLCNLNNIIIFAAGTNIATKGGSLRNKIYNGEYTADEHGWYSLASMGNSDRNTIPNSHLLVTIATDRDGIIDQTDEIVSSSKFPVGFADNVLFSGRAFPFKRTNGTIQAEGEINHGKYSTSYTNYLNVALADLCFQMKADVKDVNELLEMIRSTCLTDYIRLDGQTQELQLMNPAGFFQKYLMPTALPTNLDINGTLALEKGYYHGVIYQIPGAEVNINGEWTAFTDDNKNLILAQNPMTLEWRLNGKLLNNCKAGDIINGKIIVVDDKWNGLNMTKDFSFSIEAGTSPDGINATNITSPDASASWYTVNGQRLNDKPTRPGVYVVDGQKVIIK